MSTATEANCSTVGTVSAPSTPAQQSTPSLPEPSRASSDIALGSIDSINPSRHEATGSQTRSASYKGSSITMMTLITILLALAFGVGSWVGQNRGNDIAQASLSLDKYGVCSEHKELRETPQCQHVIAETLKTLGIHEEEIGHSHIRKRTSGIMDVTAEYDNTGGQPSPKVTELLFPDSCNAQQTLPDGIESNHLNQNKPAPQILTTWRMRYAQLLWVISLGWFIAQWRILAKPLPPTQFCPMVLLIDACLMSGQMVQIFLSSPFQSVLILYAAGAILNRLYFEACASEMVDKLTSDRVAATVLAFSCLTAFLNPFIPPARLLGLGYWYVRISTIQPAGLWDYLVADVSVGLTPKIICYWAVCLFPFLGSAVSSWLILWNIEREFGGPWLHWIILCHFTIQLWTVTRRAYDAFSTYGAGSQYPGIRISPFALAL